MKLKVYSAVLAALLLLVTCTACTSQPAQTPSGDATTPTTTAPTVSLIEKDLTGLLTAQEITDAVGVPMKAPEVAGQGASLRSYSEASMQSRLIIDMLERSHDIFEVQVLSGYSDLVPCPNLGEDAWFSPSFSHLLVYNDGYMMTIDLVIEGYDNPDDVMLRCRTIAVLILDRLW